MRLGHWIKIIYTLSMSEKEREKISISRIISNLDFNDAAKSKAMAIENMEGDVSRITLRSLSIASLIDPFVTDATNS